MSTIEKRVDTDLLYGLAMFWYTADVFFEGRVGFDEYDGTEITELSIYYKEGDDYREIPVPQKHRSEKLIEAIENDACFKAVTEGEEDAGVN